MAHKPPKRIPKPVKSTKPPQRLTPITPLRSPTREQAAARAPRTVRRMYEERTASEIDYTELVSVMSRLNLETERSRSRILQWLRQSPSWLTSLLAHMVLLVLLALWMLPEPDFIREAFNELLVEPGEATHEQELLEIQQEHREELDVHLQQVAELDPQPLTNNIEDETSVSPVDDLESAAVQVDISEFSSETAPRNDLLKEVGAFTGNSFQGRGKLAREALVREGGGTVGSERAVSTSLKWLVRHQNPDGSWSFDHRYGPCQGRCPNSGSLHNAPLGATAMALLPFLGAGHTHKEGAYKKTVGAGLYYLTRAIKVSTVGGDLRDPGGRMYSHGLASIALCEAYAMSNDKGLAAPAQMSLNFIAYAQDPVGGGWRYQPRQAGDTSVVGWQLMALKSGHMAYLHVPRTIVERASGFLDRMQTPDGAGYGYTSPGDGPATSSIGVLCRMYLGWRQGDQGLEAGMQRIAKIGPLPNNYYYNYYANQAMFQYTNAQGDLWKNWNNKLRDQIVNSQAREGHAEGSWYGGHGDHGVGQGGRLYCTAMNTMILEVYYRHMPIYGKAAVDEKFPE